MYTSVIVPLDGSVIAERAVGVAVEVARRSDAPIRLVSSARSSETDERCRRLCELASGLPVPASVDVRRTDASPVDDLVAVAAAEPGGLICMSSWGRERTGAMMGSVAEGLLRRVWGPTLLVGPACERSGLTPGSPIAIAVDGSEASAEVIGLGASWAVTYGLEPWIVTSVDPAATRSRTAAGGPETETASLERMAGHLRQQLERDVQWEMLHGDDPAVAIARYAKGAGAAIIAAGTHTATGLHRVAVGSVCAGLVHRAPCPVLVHRTLG